MARFYRQKTFLTNIVSNPDIFNGYLGFLYSFFLICGVVLYLIPATRNLAIGTTEAFVILLSLGVIWRTIGWKPLYLIPVFVLTFLLEVVGSNYGIVFGQYDYTSLWQLQLFGTPLAIGLLWIMVSICGWSLVQGLGIKTRFIKVILAALAVTLYDVVLEQVAIKQGYWNWQDGVIPLTNYLSWFLIAILTIGYLSYFSLSKNFKTVGRWVFFTTLIYFVVLIVVK